MLPYRRPSVMNDHFDREHLGDLKDKEQCDRISCDHPKCKEEEVKLKNLDHFRPSDRAKLFPKSSRRVVPIFAVVPGFVTAHDIKTMFSISVFHSA